MKKTLVFLCGIIISTAALAQNSVTVNLPHLNRNAVKTIIKNYSSNYPATVSCSNSNDSVTFIYTDASMQAREIIILKDYYVNDMVISSDSVFFCGRTKFKSGFIGYFDIQNVFFGSGQIVIDTTFFAGENAYPVKELTRLVAYNKEGGGRKVESIGTCGEQGYPCLVDMTMDYYPFYNAGCIENAEESFTDIKMVQNNYYDYYLATVGFDTENGRYINIRMYNMNNVFMSGGPQDMCHVFSMGAITPRPWLDGDVLLASIEAGKMATVSYRSGMAIIGAQESEPDDFSYSNTINLAIYDVYSILSNSVYSVLNDYEIDIPFTTSRLMNQFICSRAKNSLAFLHTYTPFPTGIQTSEYFEIDISTLGLSTVLQAYNNPGVLQQGLSLYDANGKYILSGHEQASPTTLKYQMNTFGVQPICADLLQHTYKTEKPVDSRNFKRAFSVIGALNVSSRPELQAEDTPIYKVCE